MYEGVVQATLVTQCEATPLTPVAQVARKAGKPKEHADKIPLKSFEDDLIRKQMLRQLMHPAKQKETEVIPEGDKTMPPRGDQFTKEEVNYRYSGEEDEMCGACTHFRPPGSCEMIAGLIRPVDVCNKFAPLNVKGTTVQIAQLVPYPETLGEADVVEDYFDDYPEFYDVFGGTAGADDNCDDRERDENGNCPHDPNYDRSSAGMYDETSEGGPGSGPQGGGTKTAVAKGKNGAPVRAKVSAPLNKGARQMQRVAKAGRDVKGAKVDKATNARIVDNLRKAGFFNAETDTATDVVTAELIIPSTFVDSEEGGPGSGPSGGGRGKFEPERGQSDEDKQVAKFTRRETPQQRTERVAKQKVDPKVADAVRRAMMAEDISDTAGGSKPIGDMPGSPSQTVATRRGG